VANIHWGEVGWVRGWSGAPAGTAKPIKGPSVTLTSPANGSVHYEPATMTVAATAKPASRNAAITRVEFFAGSTLLGTTSEAPYQIEWSGVPRGTYSLTARATEDTGASTTSAAVSITVEGPRIEILNPQDGAALYGSGVTLTGTYVGDPQSVSVLADNGSSTRLATLNSNNFSVTLPLFRGPNTLTVTVARRDRTYDVACVQVTGNDPPLVAFTSPATTTFEAPATIELEADAISPGGAIAQVEFLRGSSQLAVITQPPYRFTWTDVPAGNYSLTARATDDNGVTASDFRSVTVTAPNSPPSVNLTAPPDGATYTAPASITLQASASDPDGSITKVEFLRDGTLLATDTSAPYSFTWNNVAAGTYPLAARATDNQGAVTTSATVTVHVVPPNAPPTVTISAPADGSTFEAPATVTVAASAQDSDGAVTRVDFYADSNPIGTATSEPFSIAWTDVPAGSYALTARATDDAGATATSAPVGITVNDAPPNSPPAVTLTSPLSGSEYFQPLALTLTAEASDSDGDVARVEFYSSDTLIGAATEAPYEFLWSDVPAGNHSLTARAIDDRGAASVSAVATVVVKAIEIVLTSPADGALLTGNHVLVSGRIVAPFNSGVTINGHVAAQDDEGEFFHLNVPLVEGGNAITAVVTTQDGRTVEQTISVTSDGNLPFLEIALAEQELILPERPEFTLTNHSTTTATVQRDGGTPFTMTPGQTVIMTLNIPGAGAFPVRITASDELGQSSTQDYVIVVHDPERMDQKFATLWSGMNAAVIGGGLEESLTYLTSTASDRFAPVFEALMPTFAEITASFSPLHRGDLGIQMCEYLIRRNFGEETHVFLVYYVRGADGVWRLDEM
jgi:hypothetical protein